MKKLLIIGLILALCVISIPVGAEINSIPFYDFISMIDLV